MKNYLSLIFSRNNHKDSTAQQVLKQLDNCSKKWIFPVLDNGYIYPIDSRLTVCLEGDKWAIFIEAVGYMYRAGVIWNAVYSYGNCLVGTPGIHNEDYVEIYNIKSIEDDETNNILVKNGVDSINIADNQIDIRFTPQQLRERGIVQEVEGRITIFELFRYIITDHRDLFFTSDNDLLKRLTVNLPIFIRLNEWYHPDLASNELPSKNETFIQLAKAIESGSKKDYSPTKKPNTHWSFWPTGGTL